MSEDRKIKTSLIASVQDKSLRAEVEGDQKAIADFFKDLVPEWVHDGVGILSDGVKFWRWKNQVQLIKKVNHIITASQLDKKQIPIKVLAPIVEFSSLEEEPLMQEKWVNMLANAATGKKEISPNFAAILNELSPIEVSILDAVFNEALREADYKKRRDLQFSKEKISQALNITEKQADLIIENLSRLNLVQPPGSRGARLGDYPFMIKTNDFFEFTSLGFEFVSACRWEK